jgi:hypothetical protein
MPGIERPDARICRSCCIYEDLCAWGEFWKAKSKDAVRRGYNETVGRFDNEKNRRRRDRRLKFKGRETVSK